MHQSGHDLNPEAPMRMVVKPFTPPLIGWMDVRRIRIWHIPEAGSFLLLGALVGLVIGWRRRRELQPVSSVGESSQASP